jgi:hypothetical protein
MILHRKTIFRVLIVFLICLLVSLSILVSLIVPKTSFTPDVFPEHIERWKTDDPETFNSYSASELTMVDNSYIPLKLVNDTAFP